MNINQQDRDKLLNFLGYGNLNAPFWFLGMEEGSGGEVNVESNITSRLKFPNGIMDLQEAHIYLGWEYWDKDKPIRFPSVWVYMARFVRALDNPQADD